MNTTTKQKTSEIKLIENKSECYYRITVNGQDVYTNFTWDEDSSSENNQTNVRRTAKACAFDEITRELHKGNKIQVSYLSY